MKFKNLKMKFNNKGVSLVELMVYVSLLGFLSLILSSLVLDFSNNSKKSESELEAIVQLELLQYELINSLSQALRLQHPNPKKIYKYPKDSSDPVRYIGCTKDTFSKFYENKLGLAFATPFCHYKSSQKTKIKPMVSVLESDKDINIDYVAFFFREDYSASQNKDVISPQALFFQRPTSGTSGVLYFTEPKKKGNNLVFYPDQNTDKFYSGLVEVEIKPLLSQKLTSNKTGIAATEDFYSPVEVSDVNKYLSYGSVPSSCKDSDSLKEKKCSDKFFQNLFSKAFPKNVTFQVIKGLSVRVVSRVFQPGVKKNWCPKSLCPENYKTGFKDIERRFFINLRNAMLSNRHDNISYSHFHENAYGSLYFFEPRKK